MRKTIALVAFMCVSTFASLSLAEPRYPVSADEFQETINRRVESTWNKIEKKLKHNNVSEDRRQEIREVFDQAVAQVTEAIDKAAEDGSISRAEAYRINVMTSGLRGKLRGKLALERGSSHVSNSPPANKPPSKASKATGEIDSEEQTASSKKDEPARSKSRKPARKTAAPDKQPASDDTRPAKNSKSKR